MRRLLLLLLACSAPGQGPVLSIERALPDAAARVLRIAADAAPALDVLTRAAAAVAVPLEIDPALLDVLAQSPLTIRREKIVLDELGLLVGIKVGAEVSAGSGSLVLSAGGPPASLAARQALAHLDHVLVAHPDPGLTAGLRYQRACLLLESGAAAEAAGAFSDLAADFPGHPSSADARLLAVAAALRAGRPADARSLLAPIEASREGIPAHPRAELLPSRVHAEAGDLEEALLRARKVAATGRFERDRALASLMAAEIHHRLGRGGPMLAALDGMPPGFERSSPDLLPKAAFARGLALGLLRDERAALLHLRVAFRTAEPKDRPRIASAISERFAALDEPVPAWLALRGAEALEKDPAALRRMQARRAELEESFGAAGRAAETCLGVLHRASGPFPEAERVLATLARCCMTTDRLEEARVALGALADREAWHDWALFKLASLERRAGQPERALRALARIGPAGCKPPGPTAEEIRTLRGQLLLEMGDPLEAADTFRGAGEAGR